MLCVKPYMAGILPCGCGQCLNCRINRGRLWSHRIELESFMHGDSCFVTLTYSDEFLPKDGSLEPSHGQAWLKRFRARISPQKVRFYLAGEYGTVGGRPHYHAVLFGYAGCVFGRSRYSSGVRNCCANCDMVRDSWGNGKVELGELNSKTAQYVCKYVTKVNTVDHEEWLNGRRREFARMSLRPGIGASAIDQIGKSFVGSDPGAYLAGNGDVPSSLLHGKKLRPLGRYLMSKLRRYIGSPDGKTPSAVQEAYALGLRDVCAGATVLPENAQKSWREIVLDLNVQKRFNHGNRFKIFGQGRTL